MRAAKALGIVLLVLMSASCASNYDKTGATSLAQYSEKEIKQKITPEVTTRKDVLIAFGVPANTPDYNKVNHWVYTSKIVDRRIYLIIPVILDRKQYLSVDFSDQGIVSAYRYVEE